MFRFLTSEIIHNPKTCSLRRGRHFLPPSCQGICLSAPFQAQITLQCDKHYAFHSRLTYFIVKQYLVLR